MSEDLRYSTSSSSPEILNRTSSDVTRLTAEASPDGVSYVGRSRAGDMMQLQITTMCSRLQLSKQEKFTRYLPSPSSLLLLT